MNYLGHNLVTDVQGQTELVTWMLAVQICFQYVCAALAFSGVSIILAFVLICFSIIKALERKIKITSSFLLLSLYIIISFVVSMLLLPEIHFTLNYFERFLLFGMVAFLLGFQVENKDKVVRKVILIGTILLPLVILGNVLEMDSGKQMGYAYSCLPVLIASFIGLSYDKVYIVLSSINITALTLKFLAFAPRGIWVIVAISVALLIGYKFCIGTSIKMRKAIISFVIISFLVVGTFVANNFESIIFFTNNFLVDTLNIKVYALEKYLRYHAQDNVLNGRDYLWALAMNIINENPLLGCGIGYYENLSEGTYCHNIFLEALCEGGILFMIPIVIYICGMISKLFNSFIKQNIEEFHWTVFSFLIGIVVLFFSSSYWMYPIFWFFVGSYMKSSEL